MKGKPLVSFPFQIYAWTEESGTVDRWFCGDSHSFHVRNKGGVNSFLRERVVLTDSRFGQRYNGGSSVGAHEWHRAGQKMVANGKGVLALQGSVELDRVLAGLLFAWEC